MEKNMQYWDGRQHIRSTFWWMVNRWRRISKRGGRKKEKAYIYKGLFPINISNLNRIYTFKKWLVAWIWEERWCWMYGSGINYAPGIMRHEWRCWCMEVGTNYIPVMYLVNVSGCIPRWIFCEYNKEPKTNFKDKVQTTIFKIN